MVLHRSLATTSTDLKTIQMSWQPPEEELQNGVIIGFTIQYRIEGADPQFQNVTDLSVTLTNVDAGTTYFVSVAARTMVGLGMYSNEAQQTTIAAPPTFSPVMQPDGGATTSTITVSLPIANAG